MTLNNKCNTNNRANTIAKCKNSAKQAQYKINRFIFTIPTTLILFKKSKMEENKKQTCFKLRNNSRDYQRSCLCSENLVLLHPSRIKVYFNYKNS